MRKYSSSRSIWAGWAENTSSISSNASAELGVPVEQPGPQDLHGLSADGVVLDDRGLVHAEEGQHERGEHPCPVLARGAVDDGWESLRLREDGQGTEDLVSGQVDHLEVLRAQETRLALELHGVGEPADQGMVMKGDWVGVDVEPAALQLLARAQVDHRADAQRAHHVQVLLGQVPEAIGPEQDPPAGLHAAGRPVPAEVPEVDRPLERDVAHYETGMSHMGNQRVRSDSKGRSAPTMERMRNSSSVSRRSFSALTGANG